MDQVEDLVTEYLNGLLRPFQETAEEDAKKSLQNQMVEFIKQLLDCQGEFYSSLEPKEIVQTFASRTPSWKKWIIKHILREG